MLGRFLSDYAPALFDDCRMNMVSSANTDEVGDDSLHIFLFPQVQTSPPPSIQGKHARSICRNQSETAFARVCALPHFNALACFVPFGTIAQQFMRKYIGWSLNFLDGPWPGRCLQHERWHWRGRRRSCLDHQPVVSGCSMRARGTA